jgi:hypothetical protein
MAERYIPEHRRTQYKAKGTFKPEELRRRREEQQVEIRKAKREENLAKRRGITSGEGRGAALGAAPESDDETAPTESQVRSSSSVSRSNTTTSHFLPLYDCKCGVITLPTDLLLLFIAHNVHKRVRERGSRLARGCWGPSRPAHSTTQASGRCRDLILDLTDVSCVIAER